MSDCSMPMLTFRGQNKGGQRHTARERLFSEPSTFNPTSKSVYVAVACTRNLCMSMHGEDFYNGLHIISFPFTFYGLFGNLLGRFVSLQEFEIGLYFILVLTIVYISHSEAQVIGLN